MACSATTRSAARKRAAATREPRQGRKPAASPISSTAAPARALESAATTASAKGRWEAKSRPERAGPRISLRRRRRHGRGRRLSARSTPRSPTPPAWSTKAATATRSPPAARRPRSSSKSLAAPTGLNGAITATCMLDTNRALASHLRFRATRSAEKKARGALEKRVAARMQRTARYVPDAQQPRRYPPLGVRTAAENEATVRPGPRFLPASWKHVAATIAANGEHSIYVDGFPAAKVSSVIVPPSQMEPISPLGWLGKSRFPDAGLTA